MTRPIVWTIAGSDSGGGAGIQADLHTMQGLGAYGCSVITALTAQNSREVRQVDYASPAILANQIVALETDLYPRAIKLGMLGSREVMDIVAGFLKRYDGQVIADPVMGSTSGSALVESDAIQFYCDHILPGVDVLTPNMQEATVLAGFTVTTPRDMEKAAQHILALGAKAVLIKGGHGDGDRCQDYWSDGQQSFWLTGPRHHHGHNHGSGCSLSAAICALLAQDFNRADAVVIAKMYVSRGIRLACQYGHGPGPVAHGGWPQAPCDLPWLTDSAAQKRLQFPRCDDGSLGFYPIVHSAAWLARLLPLGVNIAQIRIKDKHGAALETELKQSIALAKQYHTKLFINDHWQQAIALGAYGVHLGQEDLIDADCAAIAAAGLRLGISTHGYAEVARAHALRPSYIACGPIFATTSKPMAVVPQGVERLQRWRRTLEYPLVAIGGINAARLPAVLATGVDAVAMISALTQAPDPEAFTQRCVQHCAEGPA